MHLKVHITMGNYGFNGINGIYSFSMALFFLASFENCSSNSSFWFRVHVACIPQLGIWWKRSVRGYSSISKSHILPSTIARGLHEGTVGISPLIIRSSIEQAPIMSLLRNRSAITFFSFNSFRIPGSPTTTIAGSMYRWMDSACFLSASHISISMWLAVTICVRSELPRPEGRGFPRHRQNLRHWYVM